MNKRKIAVIGAGASGMLAAGKLAEAGLDVYLFEKNKLLGKKLGRGSPAITTPIDIYIRGISNTAETTSLESVAFFSAFCKSSLSFFEFFSVFASAALAP